MGTLSGGASIQGRNVSFLMTGENSTVDLRGAAKVVLSAPVSGSMAGLAFAAPRTEERHVSFLRGNSEFAVEGNVYLPTHDLTFAGGPEAALPTSFTVLIAGTIRFNGASTVHVRADYKSTDIPAFSGRAAASSVMLVR